jgi:glycosyltransferase involved in cell wall biosynthesis
MKKNICVFIESLLSGGAEKQAVLLTKALNSDNNVWLVIWKGHLFEQKFIDLIKENNLKTVFFKGNLLIRFIKLVIFLKKKKIKLIFAFLASNNFYGSIAGKLTGVNFIIGGIRNAEIPHFKFIIQRFLHNYLLDYTIFNNYSGKDNLINKGFKSNSCYVIPNCFELNTLLLKRIQPDIVKIVSLARFVEQKDYPTALKAIEYLKKELNKDKNFLFKYQIIGYGVLENEIRAKIKELKLEDSIEIIINPPNISDFLKGADIFLTTSLFEGTSNSIMEAMSYSLPVVATDAGDNIQLIENNMSGSICEIGNYRQIAVCLFELITDHSKRVNYGERAYFKLKNEFSMEKFKERYNEFIEKIEK